MGLLYYVWYSVHANDSQPRMIFVSPFDAGIIIFLILAHPVYKM